MRRTALFHLLFLLLGLVLGACLMFFANAMGWLGPLPSLLQGGDRPLPAMSVSPSADPAAPEGNEVLVARAMEVAVLLRDRDWAGLSAAVHPEKGVRFTPYSSVSEGDLVFSAGEVAAFGSDGKSYIWGYSDGRGAPMSMTPADYFARFVFNADFTQAPLLAVNRVQVYGNAVENVADAYPEGSFVEFYYDGLDPANEGFDWCALKLVFQSWNGQLMLVGIIHSEWTI